MENQNKYEKLMDFLSNTWYFCEYDGFYFKYYMATEQNGVVDYLFIDQKTRHKQTGRQFLHKINSMRIRDFKELSSEEQQTLDLLYEK